MNSENCETKTRADDDRGLFERDWEVFVIKHDKDSGKFKWFTECCERLAAKITNASKSISAACR